jgi:hypothetical protein
LLPDFKGLNHLFWVNFEKNPQTHSCLLTFSTVYTAPGKRAWYLNPSQNFTMLRRFLRSLPHPSQASYKPSPILRQRTTGVPLRPSLLVLLGVSVTTLIAIHADSLIQPPDEQPKKPDSYPARKPLLTPFDHLFPQRTPPSPNTDEIFDLCSAAGTPEERATGISRIDSIILARYLNSLSILFTVLI